MSKNWFKYTILVLFILFLGLYFSSNAGLIDYQAKYKKTLTEKEIEQFEEDIKNNKDVDIKNYSSINSKDYSNKVSNATLKISNTIGNVVKATLDFMFKQIEKSMGS